jgi:hypothetical protein
MCREVHPVVAAVVDVIETPRQKRLMPPNSIPLSVVET